METITVSKSKLMETLRENRDNHRDLFLRAQDVFRDRVVEALEDRLERARRGDKVELTVRLPEPKDYTDQFDRAIAMVEWAESNVIELSEYDFQRYVLNDWDWMPAFTGSTMQYVTTK